MYRKSGQNDCFFYNMNNSNAVLKTYFIRKYTKYNTCVFIIRVQVTVDGKLLKFKIF